SDLVISDVGSGQEALEALSTQPFDCVVLDLGLPDISGLELIERIEAQSHPREIPIVVYTGRELSNREKVDIRKKTAAFITKDEGSLEKLLDETALFLHRVETNLSETKRDIIRNSHKSDLVLTGRKVLIVDDDIRNIFATTSALEYYDIDVL